MTSIKIINTLILIGLHSVNSHTKKHITFHISWSLVVFNLHSQFYSLASQIINVTRKISQSQIFCNYSNWMSNN